MTNSYSNIEEYIQSMEISLQPKLRELKRIILAMMPIDSIETISYGMPTFRWNGNIIHFAQAKNHIGIYPGPGAIEAVKDDLKAYKTTKGAIQIPISAPLPEKLIQDLILFNLNRLAEKSGPKWDSYRSNWTECDEFMQQLISRIDLSKEFKWGNDVYTYKGKNLIAWAGFKEFFSIWFYNGVFLKDKYKVLIAASEGKTKALRQWRFTNVKDMDEQKIMDYIKESMQTIDDGKVLKIEKTVPDLEISSFLEEALDKSINLKMAFNELTPGRRKEYIAYINEAKQEKTKQSRLEKIIPLIFAKKGLNDRYKK